MTDNKRFTISQGYNDKFCHDLGKNKLLNFRQTVELLNDLHEENEQLKVTNQCHKDFIGDVLHDFNRLEKENMELKERNNRQYKQLNQLYHLIEAEDWETLTELINELKETEEQLQREWKCY